MGSASRPRLAVIGAGMGGVSTAFFCDPEWAVDLFESRTALGGNATTLAVPDDGQQVFVDLGAESFSPGTHPMYWGLLQEIGAIGPAGSPADVLVRMPGTLSIVDARTAAPLFVSTRPLRTPGRAVDFLRFTRAARAYATGGASGQATVAEWLGGIRLDPAFRENVLLPWLASLTTCSVAAVRTQSALAFLLLFARIFPDSVFGSAKTYCSRIGLGGILAMMADRCTDLTVHTDAPVSRVERVDGAWFVETPSGRSGPYEKVVVNAPPYASREFLTCVPDAVLDILAAHEYYPARLVIHADPVYMPADRRHWCTHNAAVDGDACEASIWLGAFRRNPQTGKPVRLFKSWASHRRVEPEELLAQRTFHHPRLTPATLRATRELAGWQGHDGLYFTGHYTTVTDLQETALASGLAVARMLNPAGSRAAALQRRLGGAGIAHHSYDVDQGAAAPSSKEPS